MQSYDVVIIGGGPAGAAAAITLKKYAGLQVAIIDRGQPDDYKAGESVSPSLFHLLKYLQVDEQALQDAYLLSYGHAAAWGSDVLVTRDMIFSGQGNGVHLNRVKFDALLLQEAARAGVALYQPAQLMQLQKADEWYIELQQHEQSVSLTARYVIDCSGKNGYVVKQQHCAVHKEDQLVGLYAYYNTAHLPVTLPHQTLVETTAHGWYYLSPLPQQKVAVAFITDADIIKQLNLNHADQWLAMGMQTKHIAGILQQLQQPEAFRHYAIHSRVANLPAADNWIAAGDAAASFDPISSLGIGHALNSGIHSARVAEAYLNKDTSVGTAYRKFLFTHFETYLQMRKGFYLAEQRWQHQPFWQRRLTRSSV
jgi:flavin-dependent dehydrogenase